MKLRLACMIVFLLVGACSNQEQTLRPYSALARSQILDLIADGYVVAVEKYPRADIGAPVRGSTLGYRVPKPSQRGSDAYRRDKEFKDAMDDPKTMLITHLVSYFRPDGAEDGPRSRRFLYNAYDQDNWRPRENLTESCQRPCVRSCERRLKEHCIDDCDRNAIQGCKGTCETECATFGSGLYDAGLKQLPVLRMDLERRLSAASAAGRPYTHLLIMSMGWVNDQHESIFRFNRILSLLNRQARGVGPNDFRPIVLGLTWPSGWLGVENSVIKKRLVGHLSSYFVKANDADEVGYTVANRLINEQLSIARDALGPDGEFPRVVLIGHSFGDRILTRALFSKKYLLSPPASSPVDLYLGLQGAFSARRFVPGAGGEGAPYADVAGLEVPIVLTSSRRDRGNPTAFWSRHTGGGTGLRFMCQHREQFKVLAWPAQGHEVARAISDEPVRQVLVLDATEVVSDHNDVLDESMAELIWCAIHPMTADGRVSAACAEPAAQAAVSQQRGASCP